MGARIVTASITAALLLAAPVANASPEDPYGDDYVAIAINPATGQAMFGSSGTPDDAIRIAMQMCQQPCVIAETNHHGCVAVATDPVTGSWAGGRGPDMDAANMDAYNRLQNPSPQATTGGHCST